MGNDLRAFVDVHSYGQLCESLRSRWFVTGCAGKSKLEADVEGMRKRRYLLLFIVMFPYSYSCSAFPADAETLMEAGLGVAKALRTYKGTGYQAGQACDLV